MKHWYRLNLTQSPLNPDLKLEVVGDDWWKVYKDKDAERALSEELLQQLTDLNLVPNMTIVFGSYSLTRTIKNIFLHSDLYYENDKWVSAPCGINWELGSTKTRIYWADTTNCVSTYPDSVEQYTYPDTVFNSIAYSDSGTWGPSGWPDQARLVESATIYKHTCPILFRTDAAHAVCYKTEVSPRFNLSVRFDTDTIKSWDHAVEIFQKLIVDSN